MKLIGKHLVAFLLLFAFSFSLACGDDDDGGDGDRPGGGTPEASATSAADQLFPYDIERSDGKTLTLGAPAERIVSLSPGATEIIYAIGGEDSLAAVDNQADYPAAAANFPTKVDAFEPNVEAIAAADPDLVVVATDISGLVDALDRLSIPVLFIDINTDVLTVEDVLDQIPVFGRITGRDAAAAELVGSLEARIEAVDAAIAPLSFSPSVYHELDSTFFSVAEGSFIGNLYVRLNATNIAGDGGGSPYPQLTQEAIIAANPSVIILADEEFGVTIESVKARPGWDAIDAVQNDRIYGIDPDIISRPGPRIVDALELLAETLHPGAFE
jgi:iron complex transport system substrate-binding protein